MAGICVCELLQTAQELAKHHGLEAQRVFCPPHLMAICTGEECLVTALDEHFASVEGVGEREALDAFFKRLKVTAQMNQWIPQIR